MCWENGCGIGGKDPVRDSAGRVPVPSGVQASCGENNLQGERADRLLRIGACQDSRYRPDEVALRVGTRRSPARRETGDRLPGEFSAGSDRQRHECR